MWIKPTRSAAMMSLLLSALMLVACSGADTVPREEQEKQSVESFRETIKNVIEDSDRQEEIIGLVETYQLDFINLRATIEAQRTDVRTLNADYEATREQFQILIDKYGEAISAARKKATDSRMAFVRATTAEEWAGLKKADAQAMKNMISTTQQI